MIAMGLMSFLAGNVAILSPCVFPVVPFVVSSAFQEHKLGPIVLSFGIISSFAALSITLSIFGNILGLNGETIKFFAGVLLIVSGLFYLSAEVQRVIELYLGKITNNANKILSKNSSGLKGQYFIGFLVDMVWGPCIGPTLGSVLGMAGQAETRTQGMLYIFIYSFGIIIPFLLVAYGTKYFSVNNLKKLSPGGRAKKVMGILMMGVGAVSVTGVDKLLESKAFALLPESVLLWLTSF